MFRLRGTAVRRRLYARRVSVLGGLTALLGTLFLGAPTAQAAPPAPPSASTARTYLASLTVRAEGSLDGYSRDKFPHWITQSGTCNTREVVLKRDGTNVVTDSSCAATSGSWYSPYDGATWRAASDVDIDHVVPLAEAWRSGASSWTTSRRQDLANDLTRAQLIAVTDNVNQSKGDQDPAEWMPPRTAYHCTYARMWVWVKYSYGLTVDSAEKSKLTSVLNGC
ncbi:HNH endonuclease [Streptomyces pactum]|uniref:HNH endonuclease n=1 Tax=Streptomyces pactum TaxID=68249 RepID=A0ABS0NHE4_9ACTN|nr:HNH endonuclease family protein [Streptomyces pactum]MBH5334614.1 HNH endonuclease [Streptomyces pactum]